MCLCYYKMHLMLIPKWYYFSAISTLMESMYTRGNKNWPPCICQWPVRRYSCYHNFAIYFHHDIIDYSPSQAFRTN
jgi:hypothetical protein